MVLEILLRCTKYVCYYFVQVRVIAVTATATGRVQTDIFTSLKLCGKTESSSCSSFKASTFRPNLFYDVIMKDVLNMQPEKHLAAFLDEHLPEKQTGGQRVN